MKQKLKLTNSNALFHLRNLCKFEIITDSICTIDRLFTFKPFHRWHITWPATNVGKFSVFIQTKPLTNFSKCTPSLNDPIKIHFFSFGFFFIRNKRIEVYDNNFLKIKNTMNSRPRNKLARNYLIEMQTHNRLECVYASSTGKEHTYTCMHVWYEHLCTLTSTHICTNTRASYHLYQPI